MSDHTGVSMLRRTLALLGPLVAVAASPAGAATPQRCAGAPGGGLTLTNVAAHGDELVAVGSNGLVATARDPRRWTVAPTPTRHDLRGVAWTGERWVAIGDVGAILTREAAGWKAAPAIAPLSLRGIAAGGGRVLAAGHAGAVLGAPASGSGWSALASGTTNTLWAGAAAGRTLLLGGQEATIVATTDGTTFTTVPTAPRPTYSGQAPRPFLWQLASDGARVVAVGDFGALLVGTVGGGLEGVASPTFEILRGVAHANGLWVAAGSGGVTLYSRDGRVWRKGVPATTADLRGVAHTPAGWTAVGDQGTVITSKDGRRWSVGASALPCSLAAVSQGDRGLVAVGGAGRVLRSADGRRWSSVPRPTGADLYGLASGPAGFVAAGSGGTLLTSRDGRRWARRAAPTAMNLHTAFWTGRDWLVGGDRGVILSSRTGRTWTRVQRNAAFHSIRAFATDGRRVVAVGAGTIARRAAGGTGWTFQSAGLQRFQTGVAYGAGRFVVVGHNGEALVSTDRGLTWTAGTSGVEVNLDTVTWTGRRFLASGEGIAITSTDGLTWAPVALNTRRSIRSWVVDGRAVVGVGDGGARVRIPR